MGRVAMDIYTRIGEIKGSFGEASTKNPGFIVMLDPGQEVPVEGGCYVSAHIKKQNPLLSNLKDQVGKKVECTFSVDETTKKAMVHTYKFI